MAAAFDSPRAFIPRAINVLDPYEFAWSHTFTETFVTFVISICELVGYIC